MSKLHELAQLGQAIWLDYIQRTYIESGELQKLIDTGLRGMTSNPSIFDKAIRGSQDYSQELEELAAAGKSVNEIYEALAIGDIRMAADLLKPVYEETGGADGYVSLEVNPLLAHDTEGTAHEALRLWRMVERPNLMIKIPATRAGLPAITRSIAEGLNVNVTLIFSNERYVEVMEAYLKGIEERLGKGHRVDRIASVASFFVSRVDTKVDDRLEALMRSESPSAGEAAALRGAAAVSNARIAYSLFREVFESQRFKKLAQHGARLQRPLWASTSTKNPAYSDILYVQELIAPHTVNTLPQNTLEAFIEHGEVRLTLEAGLDQAKEAIRALEALGISMAQVTQELEEEGVAVFAKSFETLLESIQTKREAYLARTGLLKIASGKYQAAIERALDEITEQNILERIWKHDFTVWKPMPTEIVNRLGWLEVAEQTQTHLTQIQALVAAIQQAGYTKGLLLGMGGSSLAPELFSRSFERAAGYLELMVLDSTDPAAVLETANRLEPQHTLIIVSTKSGGTEETLSLFKYFYNWMAATVGNQECGDHFIAITDPGSKLEQLAIALRFRETFLNDPNIGGRYSALSFFGIVPAALTGVDLRRILESARGMARSCFASVPTRENPAARLGASLGELATAGRDKLTFVLPEALASFGDWVEQLIAESCGKDGKGILPVVGERLGRPELYGNDRVFVQIGLHGLPANEEEETRLARLESAGHPVLRVPLPDLYGLGGQFFLWELATAIAGYRLGIQPFDQPNVESAKILTRKMVAAYKEDGKLPQPEPAIRGKQLSVYGAVHASNPGAALLSFLELAEPGAYIALQAFIQPQEESRAALQELRHTLRERSRLATTVGFGPRFLHSTGQLHKGDAGNGLFIQFTAETHLDALIPDEAGNPEGSITFGVLKLAQALGDQQALLDAGRRVIRFHIDGNAAQVILSLAQSI